LTNFIQHFSDPWTSLLKKMVKSLATNGLLSG